MVLGSRPVLVVEDNRDMRSLLVDVIASAGFQVVTADNGLEALELLRKHHPCVVLLDLDLPLLDGAGVVRAARGDPEFPVVPIICISGLEDARARAQSLGIAECLRKPVSVDRVLESVLRACRRG
jgi:CheY-like chemotaxis protein